HHDDDQQELRAEEKDGSFRRSIACIVQSVLLCRRRSSDSSSIDQCRLSICESSHLFPRREALVGHRHGGPIGADSGKDGGLSERVDSHILLCHGGSLWLLCSSTLVT